MAVKITIEKFFDIDSEEFELSSFMVFCGDNSIGKTHLVKLLSTVDNIFRSGRKIRQFLPSATRIFESSELQWLESCLEYDVEKESGKILIELEKKELFYNVIEKYINKNFNERKTKIFANAFPDNVIKKLGNIKFRLTDRNPINIYIKKINESDYIVSESRELRDKYLIEVRINHGKIRTMLNISSPNSLERLKRRMGRIIIRSVTLLSYKANFPSHGSDMLYLPASREAYTRDYDYFLPTSDPFGEDDFDIEEEDLYENRRNTHSDDPFVEQYVQHFISSFKWTNSDENQEIINFLENDILRAKVLFDGGKLRYKLENDQEISTIQASSMQNEYSFFARLIQTDQYKNLVIEEPEAHLSLPNAIRFTFVLLALHQKGYNVWITTHNTFVADTINNFILMSKLEPEKQLRFLKRFQVDSMISKIEPSRVDEINALYIKKEGIQYLEKNNQGIIFKEFIKQINQFVDLTGELQNEFWDKNDE